MHRRQKPRWVVVRENEEARAAAARDARKSPFDVINPRVRASDEYKAALAAIETDVDAFWANVPTDAAEAVGYLRLKGGRSAILREIVARQTAQVFQSEMFGYAPISAFINMDDVRDMEARAIRRRRGQ